MFPSESLGVAAVLLGMVPEETEWDCLKPSVRLGGVTLVSMGGFLDLAIIWVVNSMSVTLDVSFVKLELLRMPDRTRGWVSSSSSCEGLPLFSGWDWWYVSPESLSLGDPSGCGVVLVEPSLEVIEIGWCYLGLNGWLFGLRPFALLRSALGTLGPYDLAIIWVVNSMSVTLDVSFVKLELLRMP
nr:hypothetical protein [Tanacetum cinerariifolium]